MNQYATVLTSNVFDNQSIVKLVVLRS